MEITENGYLIPNAHLDQSSFAKLDSPATDPADDHHYEHLDPAKSRRKKGRTWRIFGEAKRRSQSLGPSVGQLIRRSVASSELDLENHRTSKSKTTRQKMKLTDIVIVGSEGGGQEESQVCSYRSRKMSGSLPSPERSYSVNSEMFYERNSGGLASPLNRIPSIGSLAAASTLPQGREGQPALPPRRYSEGRTLVLQQSLDDFALPSRTLSEPSPNSAVMDDELQLLRHRVEVLERRLAGELDSEDFNILLDDRGESSTDDRSEHRQISSDLEQNTSSRSSGTFSRRRSSRYANRIKRHSIPNRPVIETSAASAPSQVFPHGSSNESKDGLRTGVALQRLESTQSDDVFMDDTSSMPQRSRSCQGIDNPPRVGNLKDNTEDPSRVRHLGSYKIERTSGALVLNKVEHPGVSLASDHPEVPSIVPDTISLTAPGESTTDTVNEGVVQPARNSRVQLQVAMCETRQAFVGQDRATEIQVK